MTPTQAYRRLNTLLWHDRLPKAVLINVSDEMMPTCHGLTIQDDDTLTRPLLIINAKEHWGKTLVHEMLHIAEPELRHGALFSTLVESYWRIAKRHIQGKNTWRTLVHLT